MVENMGGKGRLMITSIFSFSTMFSKTFHSGVLKLSLTVMSSFLHLPCSILYNDKFFVTNMSMYLSNFYLFIYFFFFLVMSQSILHFITENTLKVLKLSLAEFSLPKFYQLFGISKVKSAAVSAFRTSFRPGDRSFTMSPPEHEKMPLSSLETIVDALLEIMEVYWTFFKSWLLALQSEESETFDTFTLLFWPSLKIIPFLNR